MRCYGRLEKITLKQRDKGVQRAKRYGNLGYVIGNAVTTDQEVESSNLSGRANYNKGLARNG